MPSCAAQEQNSAMTDERPETTDFERVLHALHDAGVEFILVGGLAAVVWGASRFTRDIELVYRRTPENLRRLADALAPFAPYPRDAPPNLPFRWDAETLQRGLNFTLSTDAGPIDLLGEVVAAACTTRCARGFPRNGQRREVGVPGAVGVGRVRGRDEKSTRAPAGDAGRIDAPLRRLAAAPRSARPAPRFASRALQEEVQACKV
jgi:hypothetical protein